MNRAIFAIAASILMIGGVAHGQGTSDNCTPQPECRLLGTKLVPGAPTTGLTPKGMTVEGKEKADIFKDSSQRKNDVGPDTFRLPTATSK